DGRAEQYALAITVYETLTGVAPFEGPTGPAVMVRQTTEQPRQLHEAAPGISAALSAAVSRALAKNPAERFHDCTAFARAVQAALDAAPAATGPPPVDKPTTAVPPADADPSAKVVDGWGTGRAGGPAPLPAGATADAWSTRC